MKPNSLYAELELISDSRPAGGRDRPRLTDYAPSHLWTRIKASLGPATSGLLAYLCGANNLRVTVKRDRQGNSRFVAYDAVTQQRHTFTTEQDLRAWADQRYNQ